MDLGWGWKPGPATLAHSATPLAPKLTRPVPAGLPALPCPPPQVAGTTGRIQQDLANEEEEGISVEAHGQAIVEALGLEK